MSKEIVQSESDQLIRPELLRIIIDRGQNINYIITTNIIMIPTFQQRNIRISNIYIKQQINPTLFFISMYGIYIGNFNECYEFTEYSVNVNCY